MYRKLFAFVLSGIAAGSAVYAQTPEPDAKADTKVFSMFFDGSSSYLGVQTEEVTKDNFAKFGLRDVRGVAVEKVIDGSPAQIAGLQNGDVIVKFNGEEVSGTRKLTRLIGEVAPDHRARLTVLRGGSEREITATLGKRAAPKFEDGAFSMAVPGELGRLRVPPIPPTADMPNVPPMAEMPLFKTYPDGDNDVFVFRGSGGRRIGVSVTALTKQLSDHFGVDGGVLVTNVREKSAAEKAGLKAGDIIVEVDGKPVKGDFDLVRAIGEKKEGDVALTIVRDRNRQTIRVTPEEVKGAFNTYFDFLDAPDIPDAPGKFKIARPAEPMAPMPLNEIGFPRRVL